jgi:drug/metabolite transporter, DME family
VDVGRMFVLGVLGVAASNYFYYLAIQRTNVATAIIIQYTAPVWVLLYTVARGLQKPTLQRIAAVGLAVAGIALVIGIFSAGGFRLDAIGVMAALLAAFSFAFYNVGGHSILARYDRWTVLLYALISAALFWMLVNPPWKIAAAHYAGSQWLFLLGFSLISVLGPFSFYFAGLQHLEPTRAIVVSCLEPVFSIVIAAVALGEILRPQQAAGIVVVLVAIAVVQWPDRKAEAVTIVQPVD